MRSEKPLQAGLGTFISASLVVGLGLYLASETSSQAAPAPAVEPSPAPAPVQQGFGTIKGRLVWGGATAPAPAVLVEKGDTSVKDGQVCAATGLVDRGLMVDPESKGIAHAFAYLAQPKGANPEAVKALLAKQPEVLLDQEYCEFLPYSLAMHQDQPITIKSSDPVGHNVRFSGFVNPAKNIALPPKGSLPPQKLKAERRPMQINCDIHPWMKGWLFVFDHPFYAITGEDGTFEITGVPAGTQNIVLWQEKVGYATEGAARGVAVTVKAGEVTDIGEVKLDPAKVR